MTFKLTPQLTPEDLGLTLEEDSSDVTEEEVQQAVETEGKEDYVRKVVAYVKSIDLDAPVEIGLRRKGGILYCRVVVNGRSQLFYVEHLRRKS
jgi:hypothetical protein